MKLARVGSKNARACECILKPTGASIHLYQVNNFFIIKVKQFFYVFHHELWVNVTKLLIKILRQSVEYRLPLYSHATGYTKRFMERYENNRWLNKDQKIKLSHSCYMYLCQSSLNPYTDDNFLHKLLLLFNKVRFILHAKTRNNSMYLFTYS